MRTGPGEASNVATGGSPPTTRSPAAPRRGYTRWMVPSAIAVAYGLFAVAVHLRMLDDLDIAVRHLAAPDGVWGSSEDRAARVVTALQPTHLAVPLLLVVVGSSLLRRSLRPAVVSVVIGIPVVVVTLGSKWAMAHADPGTVPVGHGSFPSGHTVIAIIAVGVAVLLCRPGTRWGWVLPAVAGLVMGIALILAWVHPVTDVIGAGLLALAALTGATAARLGEWANESR
jgi:membrane-associated phospholipid phosphatase